MRFLIVLSSRCDAQGVVERCRQLMDSYAADARPKGAAAAVEPAIPRSPAGVLDAAACGSCDTQKSSSPPAPNPEPRAEPDPPANKRPRLRDTTASCTEEASNVYEP